MTEDAHKSGPDKAGISFYAAALNYFPFFYIATGISFGFLLSTLLEIIGFFTIWIFLIPPLICRLALLVFDYPQGRKLTQNDRSFKIWWFLTQLQMIFNRLPWLEELLRLVPGLYPLWLNLWGSRVSLFAYWAPGSKIVDRYMAEVEIGVVIGVGASLTGHLSTLSEDKSFIVDIGRIVIERGAIIGANAGLAPGCRVGAHELVPAGRYLQPFSLWQDGRKIKDKV